MATWHSDYSCEPSPVEQTGHRGANRLLGRIDHSGEMPRFDVGLQSVCPSFLLTVMQLAYRARANIMPRGIGFVFSYIPGVPKKPDPLAYFDDNFGKYGPILTIFSLLQHEIQGTQKLSYFSHLTFIMMLLYLAK